MKQVGFTLLLIAYLTHNTAAQNKTYIGLEFAVANDIFKIHDNGGYLKSIPLYNAPGGVNIRQEISKVIFIETGLIIKYYHEGFGFKTIPYSGSSSSDPSWLIPFRFGVNLNIYNQRIYFVPIIGYTIGINPPLGYGGGYGSQKSTTTTFNYDYTENLNSTRYFSLLQTGAGFEFKISNAFLLQLSASYYKGFNTTTELNINYTVNNATPITGSAISKGDFWSISTGFKYAISNLWKRG